MGPHDRHNQQFRLAPAGDGYHRIVARHIGMAVEVFEWNPENGAQIVQWTDLNSANQQWRVDELGGDVVTFTNRFSGKALDLWEWSTADGARISQYDPTGGTNQQWRMVPADGGGGIECGGGSADAAVAQSGSNYTATRGGSIVYSGGNYGDAIRAAVDSLTPGRNSQERVVVDASGSIGSSAINLPSHTSLEVCGTMNVGNSAGNGAVQAIGAQNVAVPRLNMTGSPFFGLRFADVHGLHLGQINLSLNGGLGIRFERDLPGSTNVRMDDVFVSGTNNHGVETWNVDGLTIGTVTARDTGNSGLLLNNTRNANIGTVDGENAGTGTGYAAFRLANRAGRIGNGYPTNIRVGEVIARGGGRGIFCVSESGGLVIDRVDIAQTGNNAVLIENCYNVTLAAQSGTVAGPGGIRIAARSEFPNTSDVTIENLRVVNSSIVESPCGNNLTFRNNELVNSSLNIC
ncbi:RICIN domain-containing protein [Natronosporangium hydrolyticum]|uniref:RICIN domain-containing protein n=1 Tax=Natronosporangium hydrolyticum TaxID=2811111 RepID=A0A895Y8V4_9ACTN|nr:RICIN domain-containing protein [Natronosporangium hydrolyticum]QSB12745.1 RICIN domain-containing protein [Natronosporangium hydrolyticum]